MGRGARRRRLPGRPRAAAARLRGPPDAAVRGAAALRGASGRPVWLKREDLLHTGAHKINNALGQALLAKRMGKTRIIAETGAGQHGVASATACALLGLECIVYMGTEDMRRQQPNVQRMGLLGATVAPVEAGARTLKEAVSAAIRDWVANVGDTHYIIGSSVGPAPFPAIVRDLQRVIGDEARAQVLAQAGPAARARGRVRRRRLQRDRDLRAVRRRPRGRADRRRGRRRRDRDRPPRRAAHARGPRRRAARRLLGDHAGRGRPDPRGALDLGRARLPRHRPAARAPARHRPRHLRGGHRRQALDAFQRVARLEGIIPALESSHAVAWVLAAGPVRARPDLPLRPRRQGPRRGALRAGRGDEHGHRAHRGRVRGHATGARR